MKKIYNQSHDPKTLKSLGDLEKQFTGKERAKLTRKEEGLDQLKDRREIWGAFWKRNPTKRGLVSFLFFAADKFNMRNILSLGAGWGVIESVISGYTKINSIVASDFNPAYLELMERHFNPAIARSLRFDHIKHSIHYSLLIFGCDTLLCIGSTYILDTETYIKRFREAHYAGVMTIVDIYPPVISTAMDIRLTITQHPLFRKLFRRPPLPAYRGKFEGYSRTPRELKRIYRKAGYEIVYQNKIPGYSDHCVVLRRKPNFNFSLHLADRDRDSSA